MSRASDEELAETLDELAGLLEDLEGQLPARRGTDERRGRRGELPRPPRPGEFIRFTEQYTIPTLISLLEATVAVLELLRALLRLTGGRGLPDPRPGRSRGAIEATGRRAVEGLDDVLAELNDALAGQPTDPEARDLLDEARDLRAEIEGLLGEGRGRAASPEQDRSERADRDGHDRSERDDRGGGVSIAVGESGDDQPDTQDDETEEEVVDVEAELEALKRAREQNRDDAG